MKFSYDFDTYSLDTTKFFSATFLITFVITNIKMLSVTSEKGCFNKNDEGCYQVVGN